MARLVMKFGGTSVADIERIRNVARHVKREVDAGHEVAVVVSAMAGTTNQLVAWTRAAAPMHDAREYDAVVASGEQVTAGLLAIALQEMGVNARSWLGWQIPIRTDAAHGAARIVDIDGARLIERHGAGPGGGDRRLPGHRPGQPHRDARPRRLRHQRGRDRRGGRRRPLRHLHRRRRRLHHRPAHRAEGAAAAEGLLRGDAGDGLARRQGAAGALGRARHGAQRADLRPLVLRRPGRAGTDRRHRAAGHPHLRRGRNRGKAGRHRHRLFQGRGPDLAPPGAPTSRASPPRSSGRWPRPTSTST